MSNAVPQWLDKVQLHPDVLAENFSEDIFALDLGPLADGKASVPKVYRDAESFYRASFITQGLNSLLRDVLEGLEGGGGNRVLKLLTPFGGGKSHTLAALFHAATSPDALDAIPEGRLLPRVPGVRLAAFDGAWFDAATGKDVPDLGTRVRTMWGWIGWKLGGAEGYELLRPHDEGQVAPGGDVILELLGDKPNLILLDEVLQYAISAGAIRVEQTTLRAETLTFLQRLTTTVGNAPRTALVFTLQSSKREAIEYVDLLQTVDHLAARKDQRREPVEGDEVLRVVQRRLLANDPLPEDADPASRAFQDVYTAMRRSHAQSDSERHSAEDEGVELRDRIRAAYPFHPALIDLMRERWAAIPDFQRTRGALRFLAACLRAYHRAEQSRAVLGPGDVPLHDAEVRQAFFKEVGQQSDYQAVLEHDFVGPNARAKLIDHRREKETPQERGRRPATRLATAILMYSFGGLRRSGSEGELLPPGISEPELLQVCVGPDLDSTTALACLKELRERCLYLHFDGVRYCFKKDPNVTMLLEQEAETISRDERRIRERIRQMLEERLGGNRSAIVWPERPGDIADKEPRFLIGFLPLEFATKSQPEQQRLAREILERYGDKPRQYRNGLGLAIPGGDQVEILRRAVRYLIAAESVEAKATQHRLTNEQKAQLKERKKSEEMAVESAFVKLYSEVWLPVVENGEIGIEVVSVGGRVIQTTLDERKRADVGGRVRDLLVDAQRRVFSTVMPNKIVEAFMLGEGDGMRRGIRVSEIVDGFYGYLGFTRLESETAIRAGIARGVREKYFALTFGAIPTLGPNGRYELSVDRVRFGSDVPPDEVDIDSGFLLIPAAMPLRPEETTDHLPPVRNDAAGGALGPEPGSVDAGGTNPPPDRPRPARTRVSLTFAADRDKLFKGWNAIANLAEQAGLVTLSIEAEKADGFDAQKLENGVFEPLREARLLD